jgi:hypothetical protein
MSQLIPLHFENANVRTVIIDGEPWWVGIDVTGMLDISKGHQALSRLDDYERGTYIIGTPSGDQDMIIVNESGMYSLLLTSRKPIAKNFKRWLTCEVLPSLRRHKQYPPPPEIELALPAPAPRKKPRELETEGERLFAEFKRVYGTDDWRKLVPMLSGTVSKWRLIAIQRGDGVMSALRHDDAWLRLACMGIDMRYVFGNSWTFTPEERELIANMRELGVDGQAMALQSFARQIGTLCTNPDAPALLHHRS